MNTVDRWTDKGIENAIKEATNEFNRTAIINGSYNLSQRQMNVFERMLVTKYVIPIYHKIRIWLITL